MGGGFSSASFAVAAFSVAAFAFDTAAPAAVTPELPRYSASIDAGAVQKAHRRQQLEEDEVILAIIQQFVMET